MTTVSYITDFLWGFISCALHCEEVSSLRIRLRTNASRRCLGVSCEVVFERGGTKKGVSERVVVRVLCGWVAQRRTRGLDEPRRNETSLAESEVRRSASARGERTGH